MNKRGSHVEVIISFIIFVSFIFFLFSIMEPSINTQKDKENIFDGIEAGIINKISSDMTIITVKIIPTTTQNCIELNGEITNLGIDSKVVAKGNSEQSFNCYISSANPNNLQIERASTSDNLLKIYSSDAFAQVETSSSSCQTLVRGTGYSLGLTKTSKYIFEKKVLDLIAKNYEILRNELNIPKGVNFGYGIVLSNGTTFETTEQEVSTNFYVRETPIEYVDSEGKILMGYLKTKIW